MSSLEDEGVPDPDEQPPGVDADLAQEGLIAPGDAPRAAGRHGGTAGRDVGPAPRRAPRP